jgi:hypothetical protein
MITMLNTPNIVERRPAAALVDFALPQKFEQRQEALSSNPQDLWDKIQPIAEWVCSRESTYRSALDLLGWELPSMLAAATRNIYSFAESVFMAGMGFTMVVAAPKLTGFMGHTFAKTYLNKEEQKDVDSLMLFQLNDLDDNTTIDKAIKRMSVEEPEDCTFMMDLFKDNKEKVNYYENKAKNITSFLNDVKVDDSLRQRLIKLKKAVIVGESAVEGFVWGGYYFFNRLFRKYVLKQDRFTGTKAYESDDDAKKTGDDSKFKPWQVAGTIFSMLLSPLFNFWALKKTDDKEAVAKSPWLKTIKNQWDMTHGVYPKLGLLFSYLQMPVSIGQMFAAQGQNELIENVMRQFTMVPSWWFGHKLTNGVLAKFADNKLVQNFGESARGTLVEAEELHKFAPEPAKIQHILKHTKDLQLELKQAARKEHTKSLTLGFGLHTLMVFGARLLMNFITKLRVTSKLQE